MAYVDDLLAVELGDQQTATRRLSEQPARLQLVQSLADRRPADAEHSRHLVLAHPLAGLQRLLINRIEQHLVGVLGARCAVEFAFRRTPGFRHRRVHSSASRSATASTRRLALCTTVYNTGRVQRRETPAVVAKG